MSQSQLLTPLIEVDPHSLVGSTSSKFLKPISSEYLSIDRHVVYWIKKGIIIRKFTYNEKDIVLAAEFAIFKNDGMDQSKSAVIFLSDVAYIYQTDGISYSTSIPFRIKKVFPFEKGLILEREGEADLEKANNPKFFTMTDPVLDLGLVVSSSISAISPDEELIYFAPNSKSSICITYIQGSLIMYHIRYLSRNKVKSAMVSSNIRRRSSKRRSSLHHEESKHDEKSDRSSLRLDLPSLIDRRSSLDPKAETEFQFPSSLKKEIILTQITSFLINSTPNQLKIQSLSYNNNEILSILNKNDNTSINYLFKKSSGPIGIPTIESTSISEANDILVISLDDEDLLLILLNNQLYLYNPFINVRSTLNIPSSISGTITDLISSDNNMVKLSTNNKEYHEFFVSCKPDDDLTEKCLKALSLILDEVAYTHFKFLWMSICLLSSNHWKAFCITIIYCLVEFDTTVLSNFNPTTDTAANLVQTNTQSKQNQFIQSIFSIAHQIHNTNSNNPNTQFDFNDFRTQILLSMHIIREEYKLDINSRNKVNNLGLLLSSIVELTNWRENWISYYEQPSYRAVISNCTVNIPQPLDDPPNIFQTLLSLLSPTNLHFITFEDIIGMKSTLQHSIIPKIETMVDLFSTMNQPDATTKSVLKRILELGLRHYDLDSYPEGIRIPILKIIAYLKDNENSKGDINTFLLLQRNDLICIVNESRKQPAPLQNPSPPPPQEIKNIIQNISEHESTPPWDGQSEADRIAISKLIFSDDRRFYEVSKLLQSSRGHNATLIQPPDSNEHDWMMKQQSLFKATALRTFAIPFGRAALFYSSRRPLATEKYLIPKLNFNVIIRPSNVTIATPRSFLTEENSAWGHFHNGVSAGLSISKEYQHISGSWIVFNRPQSLNSLHAGFLLGLGLNGHLTKLQEWHIYNYLGPKHIPTSISLLIGMAASHLGSCNTKLTKVLSVHVAALLPIGSSDLNVSILVQNAGLIGVGLLYYNSQHRRMTEILLSELDVTVKSSPTFDKDECYRLSAGISLGLINLGKGNDLKGLTDIRIVEKLLELAVKSSDIQKAENFDKSVPGSLIAILFLFLRTNNKLIAEKINIPSTEQRLNYIRPDLILLRILTKNLIMWDSIGNTKEWVENSIPNILNSNYCLANINSLNTDQMIYYNVIAGLCMSIGLKYSSTCDSTAKQTLLYYFDHFIRLCEIPVSRHDEKITLQCLLDCQGALSLALATIMVGTGDLDILRRLRRLYGRVSKDVTFGSNMANAMALGILFLGGGQYSFSNSTFATASLIISFYPLLPTQLRDSKSHLQALRHFWVLATEHRCLIARHDSTKIPINLDIILELKNGQIHHCKAPCIIPPLQEINKISTNSSKYFKIVIDLTDNSSLTKAFLKTRTLYVHDKSITQIGTASFSATLENLTTISTSTSSIESLIENLSVVSNLDKLKKNILVTNESIESASIDDKLRTTAIDLKLTLESMARSPQSIDDLWNLNLLFEFDEKWIGGSEVKVLSRSVIDEIKLLVWKLKEEMKREEMKRG